MINAYNCDSPRPRPIPPENVARKLAAIRNYDLPDMLAQIEARPRLVELLWHLQYESFQSGGLAKFAEDLVAEFPERIGTRTLIVAQGRELSAGERLQVYQEIPGGFVSIEYSSEDRAEIWDVLPYGSRREQVAETETKQRDKALSLALKPYDAERFRAVCRSAALDILPRFFAALCCNMEQKFEDRLTGADSFGRTGRLWFFHDVIGTAIEFMDRRAEQIRGRLAMTAVAKMVFQELDYALAEKVMIQIHGQSRFGKTEALETWTAMRPGLARLVRVPCSNSMNDFLKRVGEALGIDCSYGSRPDRLRDRIEYVVQHSGLFLVLDEASFLIPQTYQEHTPPARLNWLRTEIVDRNLPLAMAATPQSYQGAVNRFVKKTRYTFEQFVGRNFLVVKLPDKLSEADMIAVAKVHFPDMDEDSLSFIAAEARLSQNYLQAVEAIAKRTRFLASRRGRSVTFAEVEAAVADVIPRRDSAPALAAADDPQPGRDTSRRQPRSGTNRGAADLPQRDCGTAATPLSGNRSLRGSGLASPEDSLILSDG